MRHGWTEHGAPCCGKAPVIERPDEVTACGGPFVCATCAGKSIALHLDGMQVPYLFDEKTWRMQQDIRRLTFQAVNPNVYTLLTGGITP